MGGKIFFPSNSIQSLMKSKKIILALALASSSAPLLAATVSLPATVDNAGIIEDGGGNQDGRLDTLWGSVGNANRQRNGLVTFTQLSPTIRAGIQNSSITVDSVTLRLTSTTNSWASTGLNFMRLDDANADFVSSQGDWANKATGTAWVGGAGGGTRGQIFGTLTSTGNGTGGTVFDVTFSGSELNAWLSSDTIAPSILVEETTPGAGAQTRFATLESTGTGQVEPTLIVNYTVPEPSTGLLAGLAALGLLRRRR